MRFRPFEVPTAFSYIRISFNSMSERILCFILMISCLLLFLPGAPLNVLGIGAGGGCGLGVGLGWGFGAAYGTKYLDSKLRFEGIDFDKLKEEHNKRIEGSSSQQLN